MKNYSFKKNTLLFSLALFFAIFAISGCEKKAPGEISQKIEAAPPTPPSDVRVSLLIKPLNPIIAISWNDRSENEDGFRIEARSREEASYQTIGTVPKNTTTFTDTTTAPDKTFYYRVIAFNSSGESASMGEGLRLGLLYNLLTTNVIDFEIVDMNLYLLWNEGLAIYDVSNPKDVRLMKSIPLREYVHSGFIQIIGSKVFAVDDDRLFVIDAADPTKPQVLHEIDLGTTSIDMEYYGKVLYILGSNSSLFIVETFDSKKPKILKAINMEGSPKNMAVAGGHLFIANGRDGISVFTLKEPLSPKYLTKFVPYPPRYYNAIAKLGNRLAVSVRDFENELHVMDFANPLKIDLETKLPLNWIPLEVTASGNTLIIPESEAGVEIFQGIDPKRMRKVGTIESEIERVKTDSHLIMMSYQDHLYIFAAP